MLSIQEAGKQVLTGNPGKFYVFVGKEYGIKDKYINMLKSHYNEFCEVENVSSVINIMTTKHFIPLSPKLYIVRYDEGFLSTLDAKTADKIASTNIIGTLVCIYESEKHTSKCDKYLGSYTVSFDEVNIEFIRRYLKSDFPQLPNNIIEFATSVRSDYRSAWNICSCISHISNDKISNLDIPQLTKLFACEISSNEDEIKLGIAARNFPYLVSTLNNYDEDPNSLFYSILSTMIELEKLLTSNYGQSEFKKYVKNWSPADVYNMFMNTFDMLKQSRKYSIGDIKDCLIYLFSLLQFSPIPSLEVMNYDAD